MKLNNKGFAISSIMYIILILAVILISVTLAILSSRKLILDKIKKETTDNIYGISYNSVINTLKHEAISYASSNNITQENIKIEDFNTSVSQELLEHHELSDKYLTLAQNNYSYDVYLGQTKKVTDISKPIENMLGIASYKIEGNSVQQTKNLFSLNSYEGLVDWVSKNTINKVIVEPNTNYTFSFQNFERIDINSGGSIAVYVYNNASLSEENNGRVTKFIINSNESAEPTKTSATINSGDNTELYFIIRNQNGQKTNIKIEGMMLEKGATATEYVSSIPTPNTPIEVQSVGNKTSNLADLSKAVISTTTSHVTYNYDNSTGTLELTSTPTSYDYVMLYLERDLGLKFEYGKTYYYGADVTISGKTTELESRILFGVSSDQSSAVQHSFKSNGTTHISGSFTYTGQTTLRFMMHFNYGSLESAQVKYENIYLSEVNEYEPCGYKVPIKLSVKNLISYPYHSANERTTNGITYSVNEDNSINVTGTATATAYYYLFHTGNLKFDYDTTISVEGLDSNVGVVYVLDDTPTYLSTKVTSRTIDAGKTITSLRLYVTEGKSVDLRNVKVMIEKGSTATEYEPYVEPVTTNIYLNEPLRKVDEHIDSLVFENKTLTRNVGQEIYDENTSFDLTTGTYWHEDGITTAFTNRIPENGLPDAWGMKVLSNLFEYKTSNLIDKTKPYISGNSSQMTFAVKNETATTVDELKTFLTNNNLEIIYPLKEKEEKNTELPNIQTHLNLSIIEVDTSVLPSNVEFTIIEKIRKL